MNGVASLFPMVTAVRPAVGRATAPVRDARPRASLILVNYNGRNHLDRVLGSLRRDGDRGYELILVDNASTDGSADHVAQRYPEVTLLRSEANLGFGPGNNLAARHAAGEYLAFLNPDTEVEPGWLEALIAALETDPTAGLATAKILLIDDAGRINTCGNDMHLTGLTLCRGMGDVRSTYAEPAEVGAVSGAAFAMRRDLFAALGGFDESFFLYVEDSDLSLRARLAGYCCLYVPGSVVYHDYRLHFGPQKTYYQERNRYQMLLKSLRWRSLLLLLPALALAELVTWGFVLLHEPRRLAGKLRAYGWILGHWEQIMAQRCRVQALRRVPDRVLLRQTTYCLDYGQVGVGLAARLAQTVFDPLFFLWRQLLLALVRW